MAGGEFSKGLESSGEVTIEQIEPKVTSTHLKQGEVDLCEGSSFKIEHVEVVVDSDFIIVKKILWRVKVFNVTTIEYVKLLGNFGCSGID